MESERELFLLGLKMMAGELEKAPRKGADKDDPEGVRLIELSDTLAKAAINNLRKSADMLKEGGQLCRKP